MNPTKPASGSPPPELAPMFAEISAETKLYVAVATGKHAALKPARVPS